MVIAIQDRIDVSKLLTSNGVFMATGAFVDACSSDSLVLASKVATDMADKAAVAREKGPEALDFDDTTQYIPIFNDSFTNEWVSTNGAVVANALADQACNAQIAHDIDDATDVEDASSVRYLDTLCITADDVSGAISTLTFAAEKVVLSGVELLELTASESLFIAQLVQASSLSLEELNGMNRLDLSPDNVALTGNSTIDVSDVTGMVIIDASATRPGEAICASASASNKLTGSVQADAIQAGADEDVIIFKARGTATDGVVIGGLDSDIFQRQKLGLAANVANYATVSSLKDLMV